MNTTSIVPFNFQSHQIRTVIDDHGEPLFIAKDIAVALGYKDATNAIKQHCRGVAKHHPIADSLGRDQRARVIREPDLYRLIASSKLPTAQEFESLVFDEILPTIRKTGTYTAGNDQPAPAQNIDLPAIVREFKAAKSLATAIGLKGNQAVLSANKVVAQRTGTDCLEFMGVTHLLAAPQDPEHTPTSLGKVSGGMSGASFNKLLDKKGFQRSWRNEKNLLCHEPTTKGEPYAVFKDTGKKHNGGAPVLQLFWRKSILRELGVM